MKTRIIEALTEKFPGVEASIIERVARGLAKTITTEDQVTDAVADVTFQKVLQSYGDSRADEAQKTAIRNYENKHNLRDGKALEADLENANGNGGAEGADTPSWAKALMQSLQKQEARLNAIERGKVSESRRGKLNAVLEKIPESLRKGYSRIDVDKQSDEDFETLLADITTEVADIEKETRAKGVVTSRALGGGRNPQTEKNAANEASDAEVDAVVDKLIH